MQGRCRDPLLLFLILSLCKENNIFYKKAYGLKIRRLALGKMKKEKLDSYTDQDKRKNMILQLHGAAVSTSIRITGAYPGFLRGVAIAVVQQIKSKVPRLLR